MAKKILRRKAKDILRQYGEMDTTQLRDHINTVMKHGTTVSELGNILGKYDEFTKVRKETRVSCAGRSSGSYQVCVWRLRKPGEPQDFIKNPRPYSHPTAAQAPQTGAAALLVEAPSEISDICDDEEAVFAGEETILVSEEVASTQRDSSSTIKKDPSIKYSCSSRIDAIY